MTTDVVLRRTCSGALTGHNYSYLWQDYSSVVNGILLNQFSCLNQKKPLQPHQTCQSGTMQTHNGMSDQSGIKMPIPTSMHTKQMGLVPVLNKRYQKLVHKYWLTKSCQQPMTTRTSCTNFYHYVMETISVKADMVSQWIPEEDGTTCWLLVVKICHYLVQFWVAPACLRLKNIHLLVTRQMPLNDHTQIKTSLQSPRQKVSSVTTMQDELLLPFLNILECTQILNIHNFALP